MTNNNDSSSKRVGRALPAIPQPFTMPFYYANLCNCGVYYLVDLERVTPYLENTGLAPAIFHEDKAVVSYNFQLYAGQFSAGNDLSPDKWATQGASLTQELELNILAYPKDLADWVAQVSFRQYMLGGEQSKLLGNHRVHVPCDSDIAIAAGMQLFGEPKFKTSFKVNIPSYNPVRASGDKYVPEWVQPWGFRVDDPQDASQAIFTTMIDLSGCTNVPASVSPITEYGTFENVLIGCRWELLGPMATYFFDTDPNKRVDLVYGTSDHQMKKDMEKLIGDTPAKAVQTFISAPAAIQSRAYYV